MEKKRGAPRPHRQGVSVGHGDAPRDAYWTEVARARKMTILGGALALLSRHHVARMGPPELSPRRRDKRSRARSNFGGRRDNTTGGLAHRRTLAADDPRRYQPTRSTCSKKLF